MTVSDITGLAGNVQYPPNVRDPFRAAFQDATTAVLDALAASGDQRREHLRNAKLAVEKAMRESQSAEQWHLADQLGRGIKEVELRVRDVA